MRRGEIYYADLTPNVGSEINKRRPVLIVSNNANHRAAPTVTVLPITSNVTRVFPFEVLLPSGKSGLPKESKALAQQIRTISRISYGFGPAAGKRDKNGNDQARAMKNTGDDDHVAQHRTRFSRFSAVGRNKRSALRRMNAHFTKEIYSNSPSFRASGLPAQSAG